MPVPSLRGRAETGVALTAAGLVAGLGGAVLLSRSMKELLFEIEPTDPTTYGVLAGVMFIVAVLAALGPARRATRVDPVEALR